MRHQPPDVRPRAAVDASACDHKSSRHAPTRRAMWQKVGGGENFMPRRSDPVKYFRAERPTTLRRGEPVHLPSVRGLMPRRGGRKDGRPEGIATAGGAAYL